MAGIVIGKDARDNWNIVKQSDPAYTWVHLNSFPSPHVIIQSEDPSKEDLMKAACLCKDKSKYSRLKNIKVVYTKVENLRLGSEVGVVEFKSRNKCNFVQP